MSYRITTNKDVLEMGMVKLAHNSSYIGKNGDVRYRDYEKDVDIRDLIRELYKKFAKEELPNSKEGLDELLIEYLAYGESNIEGLLALFYRNLWAMAELREDLKYFEDLEEKELLVELPCKVGDTLYRIDTDSELDIREVTPCVIHNIVIRNDGDILFKYDAYDGIICDLKSLINGESYLDYYRVFLTKEEAEQKLKELN